MASARIHIPCNFRRWPRGESEGEDVLSLSDKYQAQRSVATASELLCAFRIMSDLTDANKLHEAFFKARKGSAWKGQVQKFEINWLLGIHSLIKDLESGTFELTSMTPFIISERGHTRKIVGNSIRDRTLIHCLCDNILMPATDPLLISDNAASRTGKGISYTRARLVRHLRSFYSKHGADGYILLSDFSKYYDNINHEIVMDMMRKLITDDMALELLAKILKASEVDMSYLSPEEFEACKQEKYDALAHMRIDPALLTGKQMLKKSMNIGDQTSQVIGIYYPTRIDNYVKTVRSQKYYGRYMDDFYIIAPTKEELWSIFAGIKEQAEALGIFINTKKTRVQPLTKPFRFLQIQYRLTETGRIVRKINPKRLAAMKRKLKKLRRKLDEGKTTFDAIDDMYRSWCGGYKRYMSKIQKENLESLYNSLYGKERKERHELQHQTGRRYRDQKRRAQWEQLHHARFRDPECIDSGEPDVCGDLGRDFLAALREYDSDEPMGSS